MDTKDLEYFICTYERRSVTAAAQDMFISPQGMSKSIARLEERIGHRLFERDSHGVEPTAFARQMYPKARRIVRLVQELPEGEKVNSDAQTLRIVSISGYLFALGDHLWDEFEAAHPYLKVQMEEAFDDRVPQAVEDGTYDCGCSSGDVDLAKFDATILRKHPFVAVMRKDDPLASRSSLCLNDLANRVVCTMAPGYSAYTTIRARLDECGVAPARYISVVELSTGFGYAARGEAIHLTADFVAQRNLTGDLVILPFEETDFCWVTRFITRRASHKDPDVELLRDYLVRKVAERF